MSTIAEKPPAPAPAPRAASAHADSPIGGLLDGLRGRLRRYILGEGAFAGVACLAIAFWATLAIDWTFEPPASVRLLMLVVAVGATGYLLYRYWFRRWNVEFSDVSMAILLERRYRAFRDGLITSVELAEQPVDTRTFHPEMLAHTRAEAEEKLNDVEIGRVFNRKPLAGKAALAVLGIATVVALCVLRPDIAQIWVDRCLLLGSDLWPRKTSLSIDGFPESKVRKIGIGGESTIIVKADQAKLVPETVKIRYRYENGSYESQEMPKFRVENGQQEFIYKFTGLTQSIEFNIRGGDARLNDYKIEVVENPTVNNLRLHCRYPEYMRRPEADLKVAGLMQIPQGTIVTLLAGTNKPIETVRAELIEGDTKSTLTPGPADERGLRLQVVDDRNLKLELGRMDRDELILFHLRDRDGIESRESDAVRIALTMRPDEPPRVGLRLSGIGTAITPQAVLPVVGDLEDDYGLGRVWIEYVVDQTANVRERELALPPLADASALRRSILWNRETVPDRYKSYEQGSFLGLDLQVIQEQEKSAADKGATEKVATEKPADQNPSPPVPNESANETPPATPAKIEPWTLPVGRKLTVVVKAQDNATVGKGPFVGVGEKYQLEVVTREQMAAILETREIALRQRFETIVNEFEQTRDNLVALRYKATPPSKKMDVLDPEDEATKKPAATLEELQQRLDNERPYLVDRALEKVERSAYETRELSLAFLTIIEEFENNRINTPENDNRLRNQIAVPLEVVSNRLLDPDLRSGKNDQKLKDQLLELRRLITDQESGPEQQKKVVQTADSIAAEMQAILEKMRELEDYNELLSKVRKLIEEQNRVGEETRRLQRLKLLED